MLRVSTTVLAVFMLVVAACGGSASGGGTDGAASGESAAPDDGRPRSFEDLDYVSPIGELLGYDPGASDDIEAEYAERARRAEEEAARCMQQLGFEYQPVDQGDVTVFGPGDDLPWFSPEWVAKYGLGISTMRYPQEMVGPGLVGSPNSMSPSAETFEDPNQDYVESLSPAERDAYYAALYGAPPEIDPTSMSQDEIDDAMLSYEPDGCIPVAQQAVFEESTSGVDPAEFFKMFSDQLENLSTRAEADPEVIAYRERVASCVSEAGWSMSTDEEIYRYFEDRMSGIEDPFMTFEASIESSANDDTALVPPEPEFPKLSSEANAMLAEVQAEELEFAQTLIGCDGGPLNEQWFIGEIRVKYEQEFIDANADAIAELTGQ